MKTLSLLVAGLLMASSIEGFADDMGDMKDMQTPMAKELGDQSALSDRTEGEVRKIDKAQGKITLKHGDIKSIGMPGMTMVYKAKDAAMLDGFAAGDKVTFTVESKNGAVIITSIEKMGSK